MIAYGLSRRRDGEIAARRLDAATAHGGDVLTAVERNVRVSGSTDRLPQASARP